MAKAYPLSDQLETESEQSKEDSDLFLIAMSPKERRRAKRKRKGSVAPTIEILTRSNTSSESDNHDTEFLTPMKQGKNRDAQPQDLNILITPIDKQKTLRNTSPLTIAKDIQAIGCNDPVLLIKQVNTGILVKCKHIKQYKQIQEIQTIANIPVKVVEKEKGIKGVIYGVPLEMTETEILHNLKNQKVISVKRMTKRPNKQPSENETNHSQPHNAQNLPQHRTSTNIILTFDRPTLPPEIHLCFQVFHVKQYIPNPTRCFKCQRYGHAAYHCRYKERCVRCGEPHTFEQCPQKDTPKCVNCGGAHSAAYGGCVAAKTATEVQKVKLEKKVTYAQAIKIVTENTIQNEAPTLQPATENTNPESNIDPKRVQNKIQPNLMLPGPSKGKTSHSFRHFNPPPATKAHQNPRITENPTPNLLQENTPSPQEEINQSTSSFNINNSDVIVSLIMAIISVFTKDMKNIDEMYNINMIKAAAERLLQTKEKEFLNDGDN